MLIDKLGVRNYPVSAYCPSQEARQKVLKRLGVMQKELEHTQRAIAKLTHELQHPAPASTNSLGDRIMDSRNWVLSLIMSHSYIQRVLEPDRTMGALCPIQTRMLMGKAADEGYREGLTEVLLERGITERNARILAGSR
jgi:hypothetical protein